MTQENLAVILSLDITHDINISWLCYNDEGEADAAVRM